MRRTPLFLLALLAFLSIAATAPASGARRSGVRLTSTETSVLKEMNRVRVENGLAALRLASALQRAARWQSAEMLRTGTFAHGDFSGRMRRFGIRTPFAGENLAWGVGPSGTAAQLVAAWLASPGHRANLLRPGFKLVGVGASIGTFAGYGGAVLVTTDFAA
jgi:uncharacterized protein YkwD